MYLQSPRSVTTIVRRALELFVEDVTAAIPKLIAGVVFLVLAAILVRAIRTVVAFALRRTMAGESTVYRQFVVVAVSAVLWLMVALSFLSVVGLNEIAAALGTATGFLALGVSYALSGMLADAVAGVYLLRDPDFNIGDRVSVGDVTGEVAAIELRKTRIQVGEDRVVRANADIEKRWTKLPDDPEPTGSIEDP